MYERSLRRLSWCLTVVLVLAGSAAVAQGQDSTSTRTVQPRPQPIELQRIAGVLIRGDTATLQKGFEFVKLSDNKVGVRRFGAETMDSELTCECTATGGGFCKLVIVFFSDGRVGRRCDSVGCAKCELQSRPLPKTQLP